MIAKFSISAGNLSPHIDCHLYHVFHQVKVSQELQEEEEPSQGQVDKGVPQKQRQGARRRPRLRVREEEECSRQV